MTTLPYKNSSLPIEQRIADLLARMTLEEKAGQMNQYFNLDARHHDQIRRGEIGSGLLSSSAKAGNDQQQRVLASIGNALQKIAVEESRLGIPLIFGRDVIHGHLTVGPIPLGMAAAWSTELVQEMYTIAAREARAEGIHWAFSPMMDIARDPRWGRIAEGYGEDPFLASALAKAAVTGFQGNDGVSGFPSRIAPDRMAACAKHFAGYGASEGGRDYNTTEITDYTMHNFYLAPFKAAVEAGVITIMNAFHEFGGIPVTANRKMNQEILKDSWGFEGFVVSDWAAVMQLINHGIAANEAEAAEMCARAGTDMDMCTEFYLKQIPGLVRSGRLPEPVVDDAVRRILRVKFALGLFDHPYTKEGASRLLPPEHLAKVRELARRTMVLLKNEKGLLPLPKQNLTLGLAGPLAEEARALLGTWTLDGRAGDVTPVKTALEQALGPGSKLLHARLWDDALRLARQCDVMIVALGESAARSGEDQCTATIDLPPGQEQFLEAMHRMGVPVVSVVFGGRPLNLTRVVEWADAVLFAWHPGTTGGLPVADVLFGDAHPSGKLPVTFPRATGQVPIYYNHKPTGRPLEPNSWKVSRYNDSLDSPLFPFGFGLSYTTFEYANLRVSKTSIKAGAVVIVSAEVTNTGKAAGEEIVQCYIRDLVASRSRPVRELKGFCRLPLQPGETKRVEFTLGPQELGFLDENGKLVLEAGKFQVWVGPDSNATLGTEIELTA